MWFLRVVDLTGNKALVRRDQIILVLAESGGGVTLVLDGGRLISTTDSFDEIAEALSVEKAH